MKLVSRACFAQCILTLLTNEGKQFFKVLREFYEHIFSKLMDSAEEFFPLRRPSSPMLLKV